MAISTIGTDALASAAVTSAKLASGAPSRSQLPAGTVLQVVNANSTTTTSTTSSSYVTGNLSASITPTSTTSKVLILMAFQSEIYNAQAQYTIYRNSTDISQVNTGLGQLYTSAANTYIQATQTLIITDSPATTSSTTYTLYFKRGYGAGTTTINSNGENMTITLMEIAA